MSAHNTLSPSSTSSKQHQQQQQQTNLKSSLNSNYRSIVASNNNRIIESNITLAPSVRCSSTIKCNDQSYCLPLKSIGTLHVKMHTTNDGSGSGSASSASSGGQVLIHAHSVSVLDYEYDPFVTPVHYNSNHVDDALNDNGNGNEQRIVSSGMDNTIKFWNLSQSLFSHNNNNNNHIVGDSSSPSASSSSKTTSATTSVTTIDISDANHVIQCSSAALRLFYHTMVSGMLLTSHQNKQFNIYDIQSTLTTTSNASSSNSATTTDTAAAVPLWSTMSHTDTVDTVMFSYDGSLMVTGCRDRYMRFFDPRTGSNDVWTVNTQMRSMNGTWLGNTPYILNCGFSKNARREFRIYDTRKMISESVVNTSFGSELNRDSYIFHREIDSSPAQLQPFYLPSNSLVMLHGRGDRHIHYFDLDSLCNAPYSAELSSLSSSTTSAQHNNPNNHSALQQKSMYSGAYVANKSQQGIWLMPRKSLDVRRCEIAKFIRLMDSNVDILSFTVPRKNTNLYHEDLYANEPARHEAVCDLDTWIRDQGALTPSIINFNPEGMPSVYDVSVEEGGRVRVVRDDSDTESDYSDEDGGHEDDDDGGDGDDDDGDKQRHDEQKQVTSNNNKLTLATQQDHKQQQQQQRIIRPTVKSQNTTTASTNSGTAVQSTSPVSHVAQSGVTAEEGSPPLATSNGPLQEDDVSQLLRRRRGGARIIINPVAQVMSESTTTSTATTTTTTTTTDIVNNLPDKFTGQSSSTATGHNNTNNNNTHRPTVRLSNYMYKRSPSSLTWKKRWCVFEHDIFYFDSPKSRTPIGKIATSAITKISRSNRRDFCIKLTINSTKITYLAAESKPVCEDWMNQLRSITSLSGTDSPASDATSNNNNNNSSNSSSSSTDNGTNFTLSGYLYKMSTVGSWQKRYFDYSIDDHTLTYRAQPRKKPLGSIHLEKLVSVDRISSDEKLSKKRNFCFQIRTSQKSYVLQAASDEECDLWLETLEKEVQFIRSLRSSSKLVTNMYTEQQHNEAESERDTTEYVIRGQIVKFDGGILRKRWMFYSERAQSLFIFSSKLAEEAYVNKNVLYNEDVDQVIPLQSLHRISPLSNHRAYVCNIPSEDRSQFSVLETDNSQNDVLFIVLDERLRAVWRENLVTLKQSVAGGMGSTPTVPVIDLLGITDTMAVPPVKDLPIFELPAFKAGKQRMLIRVSSDCSHGLTVSEVTLEPTSLSISDAFVLDAGLTIFQWNGSGSSRLKRAKASEIANSINVNERNGMADVRIIQHGIRMDIEMKRFNQQFWAQMGGVQNEANIQTSSSCGAEATPSSDNHYLHLYRISRSKDPHKVVTMSRYVQGEKPSNSLISSKYVYVLETLNELYIYIGRSSTPKQKNLGLLVVAKIFQREPGTYARIIRLIDPAESTVWREKFDGYPTLIKSMAGDVADSTVTSSPSNTFAALSVNSGVKPRSRSYSISPKNTGDDASSVDIVDSKIWYLLDNYDRETLDPALRGTFFSEEVFIVLVTWTEKSRTEQNRTIFYWLGRDSLMRQDRNLILSLPMDDVMDKNTTQIIVEQGKEPEIFMTVFNNRIIVRTGCVTNSHIVDERQLFEVVSATRSMAATATQVTCSYSSLNSMRCFVLVYQGKSFVWEGNYSNLTERNAALQFSSRLCRIGGAQRVTEDEKSDVFMRAMGTPAAAPYFKIPRTADTKRSEPRLFTCFDGDDGSYIMEEIPQFTQGDLTDDKCFVLLTYNVQRGLYVWLGRQSADTMKTFVLQACQSLTTSSANGLNLSGSGLVVQPGSEPREFTGNFRAWVQAPSTTRRRSTIVRVSPSPSQSPSSSSSSSSSPSQQQPPAVKLVTVPEALQQYCRNTYSYVRLLTDPLPTGVEPSKLELYLPDTEFAALFDMTRSEFSKLPLMKQNELKKKLYIY